MLAGVPSEVRTKHLLNKGVVSNLTVRGVEISRYRLVWEPAIPVKPEVTRWFMTDFVCITKEASECLR
jgi:hypothetical protein